MGGLREYQGEYDPSRLRRGAVRAVKPLGDHKYLVAGNDEPTYTVDLTQDVPCFCKDSEFHGRGCLHELAARLHDGDPKLMMALGMMLLESEKRLKDATKRTRKHTTHQGATS